MHPGVFDPPIGLTGEVAGNDAPHPGEPFKSPSSLLFLPEEITPLFYTELYAGLPATVRLRYNHLHAFYFNEQVAFFEQEMLSPALQTALCLPDLPAELRAGLRTFFAEEQEHTAMFRATNRLAAPQFYDHRRHYHFVRLPGLCRNLLRCISRQTSALPLMMFLALLQEERSLYYSKHCLKHASALDPRFVAVHRRHLADEAGHVGWDERLLDWLGPRTGRTARALTARLLPWLLDEYFLLPKRSGRNVVRQLAREFPALDGPALERAMSQLADNAAFLQTLYSPRIVPRSIRRLSQHPESALFARRLAG